MLSVWTSPKHHLAGTSCSRIHYLGSFSNSLWLSTHLATHPFILSSTHLPSNHWEYVMFQVLRLGTRQTGSLFPQTQVLCCRCMLINGSINNWSIECLCVCLSVCVCVARTQNIEHTRQMLYQQAASSAQRCWFLPSLKGWVHLLIFRVLNMLSRIGLKKIRKVWWAIP